MKEIKGWLLDMPCILWSLSIIGVLWLWGIKILPHGSLYHFRRGDKC